MRAFSLLVLVGAMLTVACTKKDIPTRVKPTPYFDKECVEVALRLQEVSSVRNKIDYNTHLLYVTTTKEWCERLEIGDQWQVVVALFYTESRFQTDVIEGDSYGISQVRLRWTPFFAKGLPPDYLTNFDPSNYQAQIALGVAAYKSHLMASRKSGGRHWRAVRFYNGKGSAGYRHLTRVRKHYKLIFGEDNAYTDIHGILGAKKLESKS